VTVLDALDPTTRRFLLGADQTPCFVLVVEDNADIRDIMCQLLFDAGYVVLAVGDGLAALELLRGGAPIDVVTLDIHLPVMDGPRLLASLQQDARLATIPVVVVSASSGFLSCATAQVEATAAAAASALRNAS
jgi:CheY-like chemotaxis protein